MADDFTSAAELEVTVSDSSLREARRTIEQELGDVEVDVAATASGGGRQPRDPQTGQFREIRGVEQRLVEILNFTEEQTILLDEINESLDDSSLGTLRGGAGGGGSFGGSFAGGAAGGRAGSLISRLLGGGAGAAVGAAGAGAGLSIGALGSAGFFLNRAAQEGELSSNVPPGQRAQSKAQRQATEGGFSAATDPGTLLQALGIPEDIQSQVTQEIDDLVGEPLQLESPDVPTLGVDDLVSDPVTFEPPSVPDNIEADDILSFLFGGGAGRGTRGGSQVAGGAPGAARGGGGGGFEVNIDQTVETQIDRVQEEVENVQDVVDQAVDEAEDIIEQRISRALEGL